MSRSPRPRLAIRPIVLSIAAVAVVAACSGPGNTPVPTSGTPSSGPSSGPSSAAPASPIASPSASAAAAFPVPIIDDQGSSVVIDKEPQKIVSLTPAATEILFKVGAGDRTVAKAEDIDPYPPEADALPIVSRYTGVDVEKIVGLGADLVIADTLNPKEAITKIRSLGIPVIVLAATSMDGALHDIELVGAAAGEAGAAKDLTASMRARFDQLQAATADQPKPRVFYEIGAGDTIYTVPAESIYAQMLELAGSAPITTDASYVIPLEKLVAADPEIILIGDQSPVADVAKRAGWQKMTAVKTGAIVPVNDTIVTRPGPRLVDGLEALIKAIHPSVAIPSPLPAASASAAP